MASILFGGPQEEKEHITDHDELVERLEQEGHKVIYSNSGKSMFANLSLKGISCDYNLILYDTRLFYDQSNHETRAKAFEDTVVNYLKSRNVPVIILADESVAQKVKKSSERAGFKQVDLPYTIEDILEKVDLLLR